MGDPRLHLHVLGPLSAVRDGVAVDLGGPREAGDVSVFDVRTGKRVSTYKSGDASVPSLSVPPDGSRVLATFSSREQATLTMPDLQVVRLPPIDGARLLAARWAQDGAWLLTVDETRASGTIGLRPEVAGPLVDQWPAAAQPE